MVQIHFDVRMGAWPRSRVSRSTSRDLLSTSTYVDTLPVRDRYGIPIFQAYCIYLDKWRLRGQRAWEPSYPSIILELEQQIHGQLALAKAMAMAWYPSFRYKVIDHCNDHSS